jgi:GNAT superfamily N-acetyltransferase
VTVAIHVVSGADVAPHLDAVARLRIAVFRAFPYLYDGAADYEQRYLETYARSAESVFVLAFDGQRIVGASTGVPLADESDNFRQPFLDRGIAPEDVFYFGESVLLAPYRGRGLGHRFFDEREAYARRLGRFRMTAFCAVVRPEDHSQRPPGYRGNEMLWRKRGYVRQPDMTAHIAWREIGAAAETEKPMSFWLRDLERT